MQLALIFCHAYLLLFGASSAVTDLLYHRSLKNNERFHPVPAEAPPAHALHHYNAEKGLLRYEYNGVTLLKVRMPAGTEPGFRHGSDGSMQSVA